MFNYANDGDGGAALRKSSHQIEGEKKYALYKECRD